MCTLKTGLPSNIFPDYGLDRTNFVRKELSVRFMKSLSDYTIRKKYSSISRNGKIITDFTKWTTRDMSS